MELDLAEQPSSESESESENRNHRAKFPLNSPMGPTRDSLRIGNQKSEIAAPNSIEFSNGLRAIVCESEIQMRKSPRQIQLNSPRELAVVQPPPRILRGNRRLFRPPTLKLPGTYS